MESSGDDCPLLVDAKVPVVILSGFLGSGKTTLLQYILAQPHGMKIAVVVNEFDFGKSIEKGLTVKSSEVADEDWLELNNGCLCCSSKTQSVMALEKLVSRKGSLDFILVETAGMADPAPIAAMFWQDEALNSCLTLAGILTLVDCRHILQYLSDSGYHEATQQILVADRLVFNKIDLLPNAQELEDVVARVKSINPSAKCEFTSFSRITNLDFLTDLNAFRSDQHSMRRDLIETACLEHRHPSDVGAMQISFRGVATDKASIERVVAALIEPPDDEDSEKGPLIVRSKAALWLGYPPSLWQLQTIGAYLDLVPMACSDLIPVPENRCLFLGRNLNEENIMSTLKSVFSAG